MNDTWEWDGTSWSAHPISSDGPLAFDPVRRRVLSVSTGGDSEWDGTAWTVVAPAAGPMLRREHRLATDEIRGRVVLFGGQQFPSGPVSETWEWDGSAWTRRSPPVSPPARSGHAMAFDGTRAVTILFGGMEARGAYLSDTWEWNGTDWTRRFPFSSPTPRYGHALRTIPSGSG